MSKAIRMPGKSKAMDLLKSALADRQAKAQKNSATTGKTWVKRADLEAQRQEEYHEAKKKEEEKWEQDEQDRFAKLEEHFTKKNQEETEEEKKIPSHILDDALLGDDDAEPPVAIGEVIDRLREMLSPITIFGETDMQRYKRLRQLEKESHEGRKNPDILMLEGLHQGAKENMINEAEAGAAAAGDGSSSSDEEEEEGEKKAKEGGGGGGGGDGDGGAKEAAAASDKSDSEDEGEAPAPEDKSDSEDEGDTIAEKQRSKMMMAASKHRENQAADPAAAAPEAKHPEMEVPDVDLKVMDKCDLVRQWCRKALKAWEKELADKPEEDKKKAVTKTEVAAHRQVRRDVRPLQKRLRLYIMDEWLLDKIHVIVTKAMDREYRSASEAYLDLSIGKAAWPVGLGCGGSMLMEDAIGLHDKFNRMDNVKDIAFALNDDVTRKFVQALKRLMNCAQRYWPPDDPSNRC